MGILKRFWEGSLPSQRAEMVVNPAVIREWLQRHPPSQPTVITLIGLTLVGAVGVMLIASRPAAPSKPTAIPEVIDSKLETHLFADNKINVHIRNNGRDGWVSISYSTGQTRTEVVRRRRGKLERTLLEWFDGNDSKYERTMKRSYKNTGSWEWCTFVGGGETKFLQLELPHHSSGDEQSGPYVSAILSQPPSIPVR